MPPQINIIVPLYNESQVFALLVDRLQKLMNSFPLNIEILLVDDGSKDNTPILMRSICKEDARFTAIFLSRNFGHQIALTAGLSKVNASEAVFIIDGDLQDPPELLMDMYSKMQMGFDVVYAVRKKRKEGFFKRMAYKYFYQLLQRISNVNIPLDSGDFSLISKRVVDHLNDMPEESRFIRGMRSWIGFNQTGIEYERDAREYGQSKYSLKDLIKLAYNGIFNFSEYPIKLITNLGLMAIAISSVYLMYVLIQKIFYNNAPQGFTAIVFLVTLFGGIQLLSIGIIGEYIVRIFFQTKKRPLFIVKEIIRNKSNP